jgi:hypothetical protein
MYLYSPSSFEQGFFPASLFHCQSRSKPLEDVPKTSVLGGNDSENGSYSELCQWFRSVEWNASFQNVALNDHLHCDLRRPTEPMHH